MSDLIIKNLCKSFGEKQVLKDYSVEIKAGKIVWLRADSGAGKTTLFRIIAGLETADSGEVSFDGEVVYCFQEDRLIDGLSAVDNILAVLSGCVKKGVIEGRFGNKAELVEIIKVHLAELGLSGDDILKPVSELSGGMKRRVALARAVCYMTISRCDVAKGSHRTAKELHSVGGTDGKGKSKLLLLDEPFTGLDEANKVKAMEYVMRHVSMCSNEVTVLIASHEMVENNGVFTIETACLD